MTAPVLGRRLAIAVRSAPFTVVKRPPMITAPRRYRTVFTGPLTVCANPLLTAPVAVSTATRFFAAAPFTCVKSPPRYAVRQSGENAIDWTGPFTWGAHDVMAPVVAEKLKALERL